MRSGTPTPRPRATRLHRQAQQTVVSTAMPAAAASDQPSIVADAVEERAGAEPPDQHGEDRGAAQQARPRPQRPAHPGVRSPEGCCPGACSASLPSISPKAYARQRVVGFTGNAQGHRGRASRSRWCDGDAEPTGGRLRQAALQVAGGRGGQLRSLLARRADPAGEPLRGQRGLGRAEPPRAGPHDARRRRAG